MFIEWINELLKKPPKEELGYFLKCVKSSENKNSVLWELVDKVNAGEDFS